MRRLALFLVALACAIALPAGMAAAESFSVTSTADSGPGSLRAAIVGTGELSEPDTITIKVGGTIELESELEPLYNGPVSIVGPGSGALTVTRAASAPDFRIFEVGPSISVSFKGLTISGGVASKFGGGIYSGSPLTLTDVVLTDNEAVASGGENTFAIGGGVVAVGQLTVRESTIRGNRATAKGASDETFAGGGGIGGIAQLTLERSTVAENVAQALSKGGTNALAFGGGIQANSGATIVASTISGNSLVAAEGALLNSAAGGGFSGSVDMTGSTVVGNSVVAAGHGNGSNLDLTFESPVRDTIVAEPLGDGEDCSVEYESGGFNIDEDGSCGFDQGSDLAKVDPGLDPVLKDNGGPTPTHALLPGSVAIDRGNAFGATIDQRGLPRPSDFASIPNLEGGDGSDVGAFELQAPALQPAPPPVATVSLVAGDRTPPNTRILRGPSRVTFDRLAKFHFNSTEAQSSFQCRVDKRPWRGCRSPYKRRVSAGSKHLFKVRAIDRFGNVDPTPARFGWRVKALGG
jgi:hypothetical protein